MSTVAREDTRPLTDRERQLLTRLLSDPTVYPFTFKDWLIAYLETSDMDLPINTVHGLTDQLHSLQLKTEELGFAEREDSVLISAGTTQPILSATVTTTNESTVIVTAGMPSFEFIDTSGGEAVVTLSVGAPAVSLDMGRMSADRAIAWPAQLTRKADVTSFGTFDIELAVASLSGDVVVNAGTGYGAITLRILGR